MNTRKNSFAIVIPYFGKWPPYFSLFLDGCRRNPRFDFLIFTDLAIPSDPPTNVQFLRMALSDVKGLVEKKTGCITNIPTPHKLCDIKPMYGHVFEDYLLDYAYWGFGDIDVIYGDLTPLLQVLETDVDLFSLRKNWISGSFCLFKNVHNINLLYQSSSAFKNVLAAPDYMGFDELSNDWHLVHPNMDVLKTNWSFDNFTFTVFSKANDQQVRIDFHDRVKESIADKDWLHFSDNKLLLLDQQEYLLYHYITEKKNRVFKYPIWEIIPNELYIDNTGFFTQQEFQNSRTLIRFKRLLFSIPTQFLSYGKRFLAKIGMIK